MTMFCRHQWVEAKRAVQKPLTRMTFERSSEGLAYDVVFGFTVVELRCAKCGAIKSHKLSGVVE